MEQFGKNGDTTGKCPFMHGASTTPDTSPLKWWPKRLNLNILHQHDEKSNPYNNDFNYRDEVKSLDFKGLEKDMHELYAQDDNKEKFVNDFVNVWTKVINSDLFLA